MKSERAATRRKSFTRTKSASRSAVAINEKPLSDRIRANAVRPGRDGRLFNFQNPASRKRAFILHRLFLGIEKRLASGWTLDRAARRVVRSLERKPRFLDGRRLRFCKRSIVRLLHQWRGGGGRMEAVATRGETPPEIGARWGSA